jgi:hypothetical protein
MRLASDDLRAKALSKDSTEIFSSSRHHDWHEVLDRSARELYPEKATASRD